MNPKNIGNNYEREFCKKLSLWVSAGSSDDLFWRDLSSGARATVRSKVGKSSNREGDIVPVDLSYKFFTDKYYIDTKSYQKVNWVFSNADNQKTNKIFIQWLKTISQCPRDKLPIMPCKIRDRVTPEFLILPQGVCYTKDSYTQFTIKLMTEVKVPLNQKEFLLFPPGAIVEFETVLLDDFFRNNGHVLFYEDNKTYVNPHNKTY